MTTPVIKTMEELERWIKRLRVDAEAADEIRRKFKAAMVGGGR